MNSSGMMYFVDGLAPSALSASRYCSVIVRSSTPLAAPKIRSSAWLKPSASQDRRLARALGAQDRGLLLALGDVDVGLPRALRLGDHGAPVALGGEHPVHRVLDVARRDDLADLDRRDLAAPALGLLVELGAQDLVDLVALVTARRRAGCRR